MPSNRQKGTALTWMVSLFFIFIMGALVVDASQLYFEKRQLQTIANTLATNMSDDGRSCSGLAGPTLTPESVYSSWFEEGSRERKLLNELIGIGGIETALIAVESGSDGTLVIDGDAELAGSNAVTVTVSKQPDGLMYFFADEISASALAKREVVAGLQVDSGILKIDANSSALLSAVFGGLLGTSSPNLTVGDLQQLSMSVVDLSKVLGGVPLIGDAVLGEEGATAEVADLLEGILQGVGPADSDDDDWDLGSAVSALQNLIAVAGINTVEIENVVAGITNSRVPEGSNVPVLGLITSIIFNIEDPLLPLTISLSDVSGLGAILDPLLGLDLTVDLSPGPGFILTPVREVRGVWPTASTSTLTLSLDGDVSLGGVLGIVNVGLVVRAANAEISPEGVSCVVGAENSISSLDIDAKANLASIDADIKVLDLSFGLGSALVEIGASTSNGGGGSRVTFNNIGLDSLEDYEGDNPAPFFSGGKETSEFIKDVLDGLGVDVAGGLLSIKNGKLCLIGFLCIPLVGDVLTPIIDVVLRPLLNILLDGLLPALGISLVPSHLELVSIGQNTTLIECASKNCDDLLEM